ncbi:MAG: hypothetical protein M3530_05795 [Thermoproteota archaeon]|nr:hypothetical protein [Thermoproteota archaeon]
MHFTTENVQSCINRIIRVSDISVIPLDEQQMCLKDVNFVISEAVLFWTSVFLLAIMAGGVYDTNQP